MKRPMLLSVASVLLLCCNNGSEKEAAQDNRIYLRTDTLNVVKLTDTMVIYESTCRGCAYEGSTKFSVEDSLGVVKLQNIITSDGNSPDVAGGNISKVLVIVPQKAGTTSFKMYKFLDERTIAEDSAFFKRYHVEVKN